MVVDIVTKAEQVRRVVMPGGSVFYGCQDAIAKTMVFIWAAWLLFGPELRHMEHFRQKVRCWSTDNGVESLSVELPDCLSAFLAWVGGASMLSCAPLVKFSRICFRSLRVNGWNHSCGNVMKRVAASYQRWPQVLDGIRNLTRFWRNHSWREWVVRVLSCKFPGFAKRTGTFTAGCAKWRFETIPECQRQLGPLRDVCEKGMRVLLNAQEKNSSRTS